MEKKTSEAFGKKIWLLGRNEYGEHVWMEEPTWDCGWYWGSGYLETYTNDRSPKNSRDISSHSHFTNFELDNMIVNDYHTLVECVLTQEEMNVLKIEMDVIRQLKELTEANHRTERGIWSFVNSMSIPLHLNTVAEILNPKNPADAITIYWQTNRTKRATNQPEPTKVEAS